MTEQETERQEYTIGEARARNDMHPYYVPQEQTLYRASFAPPSNSGVLVRSLTRAITQDFEAASSSDARAKARRFLSSFGSSAHGWSISIRKLTSEEAAASRLVSDYRAGRPMTAEQEAEARALLDGR